ncbi:MAG: hypothetical protein CO094_06640 [Anaerolineae bacterium CG_4_9_14_3_um_filter_57_17]|nr:MAG: hypothetical protein CO094_06640 [Anaerolineae bacterium CG_4_9_14_3_um_filter_57_17]
MNDLLTRYNYDSFVPEKFEPWLNFDASPKTGTSAPDFPLWQLDESETTLRQVLAQKDYTVVEFGSFT